ncbi:hypothetical protein C2S53_002503 [Perilla frutescens var. hirtella]|uniref:PGG domain-containing protein n=1 Tax=Perilla frutescens var. hirtella TaxID=608512 RepID=A0AAD4J5X5_PERFH|nr:hypothetical protein C2S53_002503 [Perilla frutescens var. hirtella]
MVSEVIRKKIYDAATQGDVTRFQEVVEEDPYLLDVVLFACSRNVLHIATMWGQAGILEEVLKINPRLARSLDSEKKSPLHIAAEEGSVEIASKLVSRAPAMCWLRDCHGMYPIHIAATNGHAEVLEELIRQDPLPAREKADRGQTALHLCVKHGQLRALQVLMNRLGELVFSEDDDGETLLHLAVRYKQVEIARYLTENRKIKAQSVNSKGKTALEISRESRGVDATFYSAITKVLIEQVKLNADIRLFRTANDFGRVVAMMIAGMSFQSMINPPGGVNNVGTAIMVSRHYQLYNDFVKFNTIALTSSMLTILLTSVPISSIKFPLVVTVWFGWMLSLSAFYCSYTISIVALAPFNSFIGMSYNSPSFFWVPAIATCIALSGFSRYYLYFGPRISPLTDRLRVACGGMVVIRNYCDDALLNMSSLIDKYVWRVHSG